MNDTLSTLFAFVGDHDTDSERVCGCCGKLKPLSDFYKDGKDSDGNIRYRRDCKTCYKDTRYYEKKMKEGKSNDKLHSV